MMNLKICKDCNDEYKGESCELGCEAWYIDLLENSSKNGCQNHRKVK